MPWYAIGGVVGLTGALTVAYLAGPTIFSVSYERGEAEGVAVSIEKSEAIESASDEALDDRPVVSHVPLPEAVKAIYMTSCVAGTPSFRERLINLIDETELNAVVIDIKDYSGTISFQPESAAWLPAWQNARCGARDMRQLIERLHDKDIFVIGRITVFQDPFHATRHPHLAVKRADGATVWKDFKGLSFIDVAATEFWDHIIDLSVESYNLGFDELNFDYVRYPSDGNMTDTRFEHTLVSPHGPGKAANLEAFFAYLSAALRESERFTTVRHESTGRPSSTPWLSVDLFGLTTTSLNDLSIGQVQERAAPYFDFVAPMVYPSHYPSNYLGLGNPNHHPYQIVYHAMSSGVTRMQATTTSLDGFQHERIGTSTPAVYSKPAFGPERLRTWIQDFQYGGTYTAADVRAQIQASYDAGVNSFMIWSPSNNYQRGALVDN